MNFEPKCKLDYLMVYFEQLSKIIADDRYRDWVEKELENVSKQIQDEISKLG